jgi:hypothetical protein
VKLEEIAAEELALSRRDLPGQVERRDGDEERAERQARSEPHEVARF